MYFVLPNSFTVLENYPQQLQIKRTQNWEAEEYSECKTGDEPSQMNKTAMHLRAFFV